MFAYIATFQNSAINSIIIIREINEYNEYKWIQRT